MTHNSVGEVAEPHIGMIVNDEHGKLGYSLSPPPSRVLSKGQVGGMLMVIDVLAFVGGGVVMLHGVHVDVCG